MSTRRKIICVIAGLLLLGIFMRYFISESQRDALGKEAKIRAMTERTLKIIDGNEPNFLVEYLDKGKAKALEAERKGYKIKCAHNNLNDNAVIFNIQGDKVEKLYICPDCGDWVKKLPETIISFQYDIVAEPNKPNVYKLRIPTWPNFIELEKDLVIEKGYSDKEFIRISDTFSEILFYSIFIPKGSKIYFKDEK